MRPRYFHCFSTFTLEADCAVVPAAVGPIGDRAVRLVGTPTCLVVCGSLMIASRCPALPRSGVRRVSAKAGRQTGTHFAAGAGSGRTAARLSDGGEPEPGGRGRQASAGVPQTSVRRAGGDSPLATRVIECGAIGLRRFSGGLGASSSLPPSLNHRQFGGQFAQAAKGGGQVRRLEMLIQMRLAGPVRMKHEAARLTVDTPSSPRRRGG